MVIKKRATVGVVAGVLASLAAPVCGARASAPDHLLRPLISAAPAPASDDDEIDLETVLKGDLVRCTLRTTEVSSNTLPPRRAESSAAVERREERLVLHAQLSSLPMPVIGIGPSDLESNFGDPRDGGRRSHRGLDIFAPRGSEIVAVSDGVVSYIGEQPKGGRCLWLIDEHGLSFYYAHLDRWSPGLYEGEEVHIGDVLGYVGTTGNAVGTPPHLHFQVVRDDEAIDPYPLLKADGRTLEAHRPTPLEGGFSRGGSR